MAAKAIHHANITWDEKGLPHSKAFDDKYFCKDDGYAESLYTFCGGNHLIERFQGLGAGTFVIGETGFGTGLNFLSAWQLFEQHAPADAHLHFISLEKFPLSVNDLERSLIVWKDLGRQAGELVSQYEKICSGSEGKFLGGRITLTILFDDVLAALDEMKARSYVMDAWFLDGFAPSKNPDMWSPEVFKRMAAVSRTGTTLATFTCAGHVRRGLQDAGFQMEKAPGFGVKRHMLKGEKDGMTTKSYHILALGLSMAVLLTGCDRMWQSFSMMNYEKNIRKFSREIDQAKDQAQKAQAYSARGAVYSEEARYARFIHFVTWEKYGRIFDLALKDYELALVINPRKAEFYFGRGMVYYNRAFALDQRDLNPKEFLDLALSDFTQAVKLDINYALAWDRKGLIHMSNGEYEQAILAFTQLMRVDPSSGASRLADAYCQKAYKSITEKKTEEAIADYQKSVDMRTPTSECECDPYNALAGIYLERKEFDKSRDVVRKAREAKRRLTRGS